MRRSCAAVRRVRHGAIETPAQLGLVRRTVVQPDEEPVVGGQDEPVVLGVDAEPVEVIVLEGMGERLDPQEFRSRVAPPADDPGDGEDAERTAEAHSEPDGTAPPRGRRLRSAPAPPQPRLPAHHTTSARRSRPPRRTSVRTASATSSTLTIWGTATPATINAIPAASTIRLPVVAGRFARPRPPRRRRRRRRSGTSLKEDSGALSWVIPRLSHGGHGPADPTAPCYAGHVTGRTGSRQAAGAPSRCAAPGWCLRRSG